MERTTSDIAVTTSCTSGSPGRQSVTLSGANSCTFSYSPAATPADIKVRTHLLLGPEEVVAFKFNDAPDRYTLSASELPTGYILSGTTGATTTSGEIANTQSYWAFQNAPSTINSITIFSANTGQFSAGVCGPEVPSVAAPTVSAVSPAEVDPKVRTDLMAV